MIIASRLPKTACAFYIFDSVKTITKLIIAVNHCQVNFTESGLVTPYGNIGMAKIGSGYDLLPDAIKLASLKMSYIKFHSNLLEANVVIDLWEIE